jgi:hypothetical protein
MNTLQTNPFTKHILHIVFVFFFFFFVSITILLMMQNEIVLDICHSIRVLGSSPFEF